MKTEQLNVGIISTLSSMDEAQLSRFLGDYSPIPDDAVNDERVERIRRLTLDKVKLRRSLSALRMRRAIVALAAALVSVVVLASGVLGIAMLGEKDAESMDSVEGNGSAPPPLADSEDSMLFYDTFENIEELNGWLRIGDSSLSSARWLTRNGVPIITDFASAEDCRFGLYYNCIEVVNDNEDIGNGYMVYLLEKECTDVYDACLAAGINIKESYSEGEYSEGQILINGKVCEGIKTVGESGDSFFSYYILHERALFLVNAESDEQVSDITVEYVK